MQDTAWNMYSYELIILTIVLEYNIIVVLKFSSDVI